MKEVIIDKTNGDILYRVEVSNKTPKDREIRVAIEKLIKLGESLAYAHLQDANLDGASLVGADFSMANLEGASLKTVDLQEAYLYRTNMIGANLEGANLYAANLALADLTNANIIKANLKKASMNRVNLRNAFVKDCDLSNINFGNSELHRTNFTGSKLKEDVYILEYGHLSVADIIFMYPYKHRCTLHIFNTTKGLYLNYGNILENEEEFRKSDNYANKNTNIFNLAIKLAKAKFKADNIYFNSPVKEE